MATKNEELALAAKLAAIQQNLHAPKAQYNAFGKYKYRKCEDILELVKPHLQAQCCALTLSDELVLVGDRYYIKATASLMDTASGAAVSVTAWAREEEKKSGMDGSQITGASSSYARKYALNGLFAIDDTDDSDTTNNGQNQGQSQQRSSAPVAPQNAGKSKTKHLSEDKYWDSVAKYAEGVTLDNGGSIRDWLEANTDTDMDRFDADVDNYRAAHI